MSEEARNRFRGARVRGSREAPDAGAGNTAETLWKSSKLSHPLSHLSRPHPSIHLKILSQSCASDFQLEISQ